MPNKQFLEEYPLYKEFKTTWNTNVAVSMIKKPAIHLHCEVCNSEQTFNMDNEYTEVDFSSVKQHVGDGIVRAKYRCSACNQYIRQFYIKFFQGENTSTEGLEYTCVSYMKVGQFPAWSIKMDKELENILGEYADYYKKGLTCESQSYGIGAYAYFRRITENVIGELLGDILEMVETTEEKEEYKEALELVKDSRNAEEKIEAVQDLLPKSLKADGINPLKALYGVLSSGIHGLTDDECMEKAEIIRSVLVYLVNQIKKTKNDKDNFVDSIKELLK